MSEINATVEGIVENVVKNATSSSTPEGKVVAYGSLVLMALLPIFFGSFRSVKFQTQQKTSGLPTETMTTRDAAMFPIMASVTLGGLYIFFKIFNKDYVNMIMTAYFFFLGVLALAHILSPFFNRLNPSWLPSENFHFIFTKGQDDKKEDLIDYKFSTIDLICLVFCVLLGVWYLVQKHWLANNLFGLAFSLNAIEFLQLNKISTGCILLGGLFFYDIFWVFGTDVMVTVAKSFEAPIKLVFPQDIMIKGLWGNNFAMLGLGDIVIPGIFIALLLRYDMSMHKDKRTYFYSGFLAYIFGILVTLVVMHVFKHPQPALLYLVPCCLGIPILTALIKGDIKSMLNYEDNPETTMPTETTEKKKDE